MKTTIFLYSVEGVQLDIYETKQPVSFKKIREFIEYKTNIGPAAYGAIVKENGESSYYKPTSFGIGFETNVKPQI